MSPPEVLRVAVVGCGQIADAHLSAVRTVAGARTVAVCDQHPDLARQAAERFGIPGVFSDFDQMLTDARPDVVHITTPPHTHAALACQALAAGAHVYVEKPFALDASEADRVFRAAKVARRLVCAGHDQLFDPCWLECRARVAGGEVGRVVHVDSVIGYDLSGPFGRVMFSEPEHWLHRLPGGLFHNNISHAICKVVDLISDERPTVWAAWYGESGPDSPPTELRVLLRWPAATANVLFTCAARPLQRLVRVYGTRRTLEVDFDGRLVRTRGPVVAPGPFAKLAIPWQDLKAAARGLTRNAWRFFRSDLHYFAGMNRLVGEFYRSILGRAEIPVPERDVLRVTGVMDQVFAACRGAAKAPRPAAGRERAAVDRRNPVGIPA
jgi:predicted dehydrogenase